MNRNEHTRKTGKVRAPSFVLRAACHIKAHNRGLRLGRDYLPERQGGRDIGLNAASVRKYAAEQGISEAEALKRRMGEKSKKLVVYVKV